MKKIFEGVRTREKTPRVRAFHEKLQMLKNKKQRTSTILEKYKIDFLMIETSDMLEKLSESIED